MSIYSHERMNRGGILPEDSCLAGGINIRFRNIELPLAAYEYMALVRKIPEHAPETDTVAIRRLLFEHVFNYPTDSLFLPRPQSIMIDSDNLNPSAGDIADIDVWPDLPRLIERGDLSTKRAHVVAFLRNSVLRNLVILPFLTAEHAGALDPVGHRKFLVRDPNDNGSAINNRVYFDLELAGYNTDGQGEGYYGIPPLPTVGPIGFNFPDGESHQAFYVFPPEPTELPASCEPFFAHAVSLLRQEYGV